MTAGRHQSAQVRPVARSWERRFRAGLTLACTAVVYMLHARAAGAQTLDDTQLWISAQTTGPIKDAWRISAELQTRWVDDVQHYQRTVLRLQGGRALTPHLTAWFGFEENWPVANRTPQEARIWQQVIFVQPVGAWAFSHRARLEERFIKGADRMVPRLRYSLRATRSFHPKSAWAGFIGAELYVLLAGAHLNGHLHPAGFDRDRVQAGISRRLTRAVSFEPSYILQYIDSPQPLPNRREHVIQMQVVHRF